MIIGGTPVYREQEAQAKWCPHARDMDGSNKVFTDGDAWCQGSACMMWRWRPLAISDPGFKEAVQTTIKDKKINHTKAVEYVLDNRAEFGLETVPYLGYCGLAGQFEK